VNKGYLLTPDTGLLFQSDDSDTTTVETPQTKTATSEEKAAEEKTWKRQCLLNYRMGPGDLIQIQSRDLNGKYLIISGKHKGTPTGNWLTEIEVKAAG
jgi:hypothetical protein